MAFSYYLSTQITALVITKSYRNLVGVRLYLNAKFNSKDVAVTSRHNVKEEPTPVLIPFYLLEFEFMGKAYYIAMMADNSFTLKGQIPPIEETNKTPQQLVEEEMPDKVKKVKMIK